jgi:hypothetical protein
MAMRRAAVLVFLLLVASPGGASDKEQPPPALSREVVAASRAFKFRIPDGWTTGVSPTNPRILQAQGNDVMVRFLFEPTEEGFDSLHALCMLERLAGESETDPAVNYEYDFISWTAGERRVLDSAFVVKYHSKIGGSQEWRQRNVTIVGKGESLCVISYAPAKLWKHSKGTRDLLDGIIKSVVFAQ